MKKIILSALLLVTPALANAATCTRADLTGTWKLYTTLPGGVPGRCSLVMPATGTAVAATSSCSSPGTPATVPFTGSIAIGTDCHVTGSIKIAPPTPIPPITFNIDAYISKSKDTMAGMDWGLEGATLIGSPFSGVKQ